MSVWPVFQADQGGDGLHSLDSYDCQAALHLH